MSRLIYDYTKSVLERVSFDAILFCKELDKAFQSVYVNIQDGINDILAKRETIFKNQKKR